MAVKTDILGKLIEIFERIIPSADTSKVTPEASLSRDLGIDSLNMMLLGITVEDEFNIRMENTDFETVGDIIKYIEGNEK